MKFVNASNASKATNFLFGFFKEVVLMVRGVNAVQFAIDNVANYIARGKLLEEELVSLCCRLLELDI